MKIKRQTGFRRMLLEPLIKYSLVEMENNPQKGINKLMELSTENVSDSRQKELLAPIQQLLKEEDSPYYSLIQDTLKSVHHERLLTFGVHAIWNSLSSDNNPTQETHIPWNLTFHLGEGQTPPAGSSYEQLLQYGQKNGIYVYFLFVERTRAAFETAHSLISLGKDCAFCLFLPPKINEVHLKPFLPFQNLLFLVNTEEQNWDVPMQYLAKNKCMRAVYQTYGTEAEAEDITCGHWLDRVGANSGMAAITVASLPCPPHLKEKVQTYIHRIRHNPQAPIFPLDYYHDILESKFQNHE